jgi:hypothetical protein
MTVAGKRGNSAQVDLNMHDRQKWRESDISVAVTPLLTITEAGRRARRT